MNKKQWIDPEVNELGVESTEYGTKITNKTDAIYHDCKGNAWYSFS